MNPDTQERTQPEVSQNGKKRDFGSSVKDCPKSRILLPVFNVYGNNNKSGSFLSLTFTNQDGNLYFNRSVFSWRNRAPCCAGSTIVYKNVFSLRGCGFQCFKNKTYRQNSKEIDDQHYYGSASMHLFIQA